MPLVSQPLLLVADWLRPRYRLLARLDITPAVLLLGTCTRSTRLNMKVLLSDGEAEPPGLLVMGPAEDMTKAAGASGVACAISERFVGEPLGPPDLLDAPESRAVKAIQCCRVLFQGHRGLRC